MSSPPAPLPPAALPIGLLAAAAFISSAGARVIDPLLHVIATDFGTTVPVVSIVVAAFTLPYGLCQIFLGPFGDRFGKLRVMLFGMVGFAIATAGCALAGDLASLSVMRVLAGGTSAALIPVGMAYIGDAVPYAERQVTLSRFLNGVVMAQMLAGPMGGVFGQYFGWRGVFVLLAIGAVIVSVALGRRIGSLPDRRNAEAGLSLNPYFALARTRFARRLLICAFFDGMLLVGCFPFLAPYMHEAFGLPYAGVGLVLACFGIGALAYTRLARRLVPLLGEPNMVLGGGAIIATALILGMASPRWEVFIAVEFALGMGFFLLHGVMQARATEMLPQARATAVASFAFMLFAGQSAGALVMGALIAHFGYGVAFAADAAGVLSLGFAVRQLVQPPKG
jgi:predicted MFS family arabinose efflux permease